jgi:multiple sugar transport system ATP-binding protein
MATGHVHFIPNLQMAQVILDHVTKFYPNGVCAVRDMDLVVADGELITLVGPSGCGKTTTLRLIAGLEDPTTGTIVIGGRKADTLPPRDRDVAMVFQQHGLYPHLDVRRNLEFGLRLRQSGWWFSRWLGKRARRAGEKRLSPEDITRRVIDAAQLLDLSRVLERMPDQLSGGEHQRAALGRALVRRPGVFLLDEPLSQLDARLRSEIRGQLHLLHRRLAATIIYVTHDQAEAMALGHRLVVMNQGEVQQADSPARVYDHPRNRFVAGFLGWPPMNLVNGRFIQDDGKVCFEAAGLRLPLAATGTSVSKSACQHVTFGIRADAVSIAKNSQLGPTLSMEVVRVEPVGGDALVMVQRDKWRLTVKVNGWSPVAVGQVVDVEFEMQQAHWFHATSGLALDVEGPAG